MEHGAAPNTSVAINLACCLCYGMHNEFGESRPVGEVQGEVHTTGMMRRKVI